MTRLHDFVVLKRLSIHDIKIKPRQVTAAYTLTYPDGEEQSTRLIYSYQEKLFNPNSAADINLASLMAAQVALNYGLFCQELEFHGLFSKADKRFLLDMLENTSREILTNKLLSDNEFLLKPFDELKVEKQERYTQAEVMFSDSDRNSGAFVETAVKTDINKYAILSSGGKDSLLSYGMIKEFGQPYPVFVNESGRHWFTAVNSYRHYLDKEPNTAKVWCNSDRVFNWMLKHLSFIRKDYASIRADIYPVRLWTVAVFLFGVLPFALKRGMGNIIIGDEYDTTEKGVSNGITHYCGLYDQSKYFDNALTRFFSEKKWEIYQYSMLRSLSEILIMKVLLKRYPHLQRHQMSCHAAHEKDHRMYPCGNCEKCRRIIGMISALGENPENCGYSHEQIKVALQKLPAKKVKQIGTDAAQLFYLLLKKGLIEDNGWIRKMAKENPQVMKLRFDKHRSNLEDLPNHVRKPLFEIYTKYADGAMERIDRKWHDIEVTDEFLFKKPYKFEIKNE